ncbi:MAG: SpoIIE family protein phosphatase [Bacteroidales bacterium]|nr:SpoIIE family protein phosphatase [Bacteroidales bacterium]
MNRIVSLVFLSFLTAVTSAQRGSPLLTHFIESRETENQSWAICQDENKVMLFANRKGILAFDGQEWKTIRIATIPYTMKKNPADKKIYIGGDNNYGFLYKDENENYRYSSLSGDSAGTGIITRIIFKDSLVWFCSDESLVRFNLETQKQELHISAKPGFPFTGIFFASNNTFINVLDKGLHRLESDTLFPIVTGYLTENVDILFSLPYNNSRVLTGRSDGTLALFDGIKYYDYPIRDDGYLAENILSEGITLGDTAYAFSTLEGGAIVIEKVSGKVLYTINNQNELPDDEVFATGSDNSGGLWLSHQYGLTRADLSLPLENFTIFPGLKGNLSSAVKYNSELYVATSEGVFYLTEVKNYAEVEVLIKDTSSAKEKRGSAATETPQEQQAARKNIFSRIFGKKAEQKSAQTAPSSEQPQAKTEKKPVASYTRRTVSKLKSINYIYKKVEGLNEKCRQLVATPYGILSATNKGLYIIKDHRATTIVAGKYINFISWQPVNQAYCVAASEGCLAVKYLNGKWVNEQLDPEYYYPVYSVIHENENTIWLGGDNLAARIELNSDNSVKNSSDYSIKKDYPDRYNLRIINDTVFLFTESEIHYFNKAADKFSPYLNVRSNLDAGKNYLMPLSNYTLIRQNNDWTSFDATAKVIDRQELSLLKIFDDIVFAGIEKNDLWVIDGNNRIFGINRLSSSKINPSTDILIKNITNNRGTKFNLRDVKFERGDNVINFEIVAPSYIKQNTTQYQYIISRVMTDWSQWSENTHYDKVITRPGDYTLRVRAKDLWGNIGDPVSLEFTIRAPFTKTLFFYLLIGIAALALMVLIIRFREKALQQTNRILEQKVKERTAEIEAQKEEITASIEYAGRIQRAMLPVEDHFKESFSDYFIMFKPRDIVSGDFYWIGMDDKAIFFTVSDCTGHGVPGAFMSTMGISTLNEIIANNRDLQANTVLNLLREKTMHALHQTGKEGEAADGMDIAFCILNKNRRTLQFSGAFNPLIIFQGGEFKEYRADRMPIGIHYGDEKSFTNYVIPVTRGDTLYIFSDGFTDQFGGPDGVKYKMANFRNLLKEIYYRPMIEQRNILESEFQKWRGNMDQVDDITIIGIRI